MKPIDRLTYSPIVERASLKLPGNARVAVWIIVNVEVWDIGRLMPRQVLPPPTGLTQLPDVPHWSWHEYGMRVGFWRMKAALDRLGIVPSLTCNARVCEVYPQVAAAAREGKWEFMGHSYDQRPIHSESDQRAMIGRSLDILERFSGKRPVGWLSPGLTETLYTPEYLAEAGVRYIADWVIDDEPVWIDTAHGPLAAMPYTVELNDIAMMPVQHHAAAEFVSRCADQFERLYEEGKTRPKIMAIAVHPYISGVPHRIKYFEQVLETLQSRPGVVFWTGERILDWFERALPRPKAAPRPAS
ncbi:MAG: polysaccharide deacetylase [Betaproteobacteria bacterium]|nr:polysaccharide deacetylase [Betaproteobacteria bacterium]